MANQQVIAIIEELLRDPSSVNLKTAVENLDVTSRTQLQQLSSSLQSLTTPKSIQDHEISLTIQMQQEVQRWREIQRKPRSL
jgi:PleD family two-component response regulator